MPWELITSTEEARPIDAGTAGPTFVGRLWHAFGLDRLLGGSIRRRRDGLGVRLPGKSDGGDARTQKCAMDMVHFKLSLNILFVKLVPRTLRAGGSPAGGLTQTPGPNGICQRWWDK